MKRSTDRLRYRLGRAVLPHMNSVLQPTASTHRSELKAGAILFATGLALPTMAQAQSAPGWEQTLSGLLTGNQNQDDALRQAYQRGYQRGREDEARAIHANNRGGDADQYSVSSYGEGYDNDNGPQGGYSGYGQQGSYQGR